eukprot:457934-Pelagomonas_calceolata.AAC.2
MASREDRKGLSEALARISEVLSPPTAAELADFARELQYGSDISKPTAISEESDQDSAISPESGDAVLELLRKNAASCKLLKGGTSYAHSGGVLQVGAGCAGSRLSLNYYTGLCHHSVFQEYDHLKGSEDGLVRQDKLWGFSIPALRTATLLVVTRRQLATHKRPGRLHRGVLADPLGRGAGAAGRGAGRGRSMSSSSSSSRVQGSRGPASVRQN